MSVAYVRGAVRPPRHAAGAIVETDIPARLDRLPWGRFHTLVVVALGITWILDGLEVTLAGAVAGALQAKPGPAIQQHRHRPRRQRLSRRRRAGRRLLRLADRPAGAQEAVLHHACRLPHRHRGHGVLLEPVELRALPLRHRRRHRRRIRGHQLHHPGADPGARARLDRSRHQRQLLGRRGDRRRRVDRAARSGAAAGRHRLARGVSPSARRSALSFCSCACGCPKARAGSSRMAGRTRPRRSSPASKQTFRRARPRAGEPGHFPRSGCAPAPTRRSREVVATLFRAQRQRTFVGLSLMAAQAFFYNAIFFTYALVLTEFYGIRADHVGWYILPFAAGNFLGPCSARPPVRHLGRRPMLTFTYAMSGLLLAGTGYLFAHDLVSRRSSDRRLDDHLLLRLRRRQRRLPDGQRDVSRSRSARSPSPSSMPSAPASAAWPARCCSAP